MGIFDGLEEWGGKAGDMLSGSLNPVENDLDKKQKELEKERERQLGAQQEAWQKELEKSRKMTERQSQTEPGGTAKDTAASTLKTGLSDPLAGLPEKTRNEMLLNKYDSGHRVPGGFGGIPLVGKAKDSYIETWKKRVNGMSQDLKDVTWMLNERHDTIFRKWADVQRQNAQAAQASGNGNDGAGAASQEKAKPSGGFLEQVASVNVPEDMTVKPAIDALNSHAISPLGNNPLYQKDPPGTPDATYGPGERWLGNAVAKAANGGLGMTAGVHGKDGTRPAGEASLSMKPGIDGIVKPALGYLADNAKHKETAESDLRTAEAQGTVMNRENGSDVAYHLGRGLMKGPDDLEHDVHKYAAFSGDLFHKMLGGDDKAIRQLHEKMSGYRNREKSEGWLKGEDVTKGWESWSENGSNWLAEQAGRKSVYVPLALALGSVKGVAMVTGLSEFQLATNLYEDVLERTGKGEPVESLMYAAPVAALNLFMPGRMGMKAMKSTGEVLDYIKEKILGIGVKGAQKQQIKMFGERIEQKDKYEDK